MEKFSANFDHTHTHHACTRHIHTAIKLNANRLSTQPKSEWRVSKAKTYCSWQGHELIINKYIANPSNAKPKKMFYNLQQNRKLKENGPKFAWDRYRNSKNSNKRPTRKNCMLAFCCFACVNSQGIGPLTPATHPIFQRNSISVHQIKLLNWIICACVCVMRFVPAESRHTLRIKTAAASKDWKSICWWNETIHEQISMIHRTTSFGNKP